MSQNPSVNRQIVLAEHPMGAPTLDDFRLDQTQVPTPAEGQVLLRTVYLSLDPYMRSRMNDGPSYAASVPVNGVMVGGTVCQVEISNHSGFLMGDLVLANTGWQDVAVSDGTDLTKLDPAMAKPSYALGVLGMPGFTAYVGLLDIGQPKPGETVVVAAATGAVGSVVGQIAKLKGCRVIGIAGGADKCNYAVEELGFDDCVDHHSADLPKVLAEACPAGIDVYFESVGGEVSNSVFPLLNIGSRVPLCGLIAHYNAEKLPDGPDRSPLLMRTLLTKRIKMQGFIIFDHYGDRYGEFFKDMVTWLQEGKIKYREDEVGGLENAPQAFIGLLEGGNFGKLVVRVGEK